MIRFYNGRVLRFGGGMRVTEDEVWTDGGRICHLHVNDSVFPTPGMDRLPIMHIGEGRVDFGAFFALLKKRGDLGTATVESTSVRPDGSVDLDRLNLSLEEVRRGLNG